MSAAQRLAVIGERFDRLTVRERVLATAGAVAILYTAWHGLLMSPLYETHQTLEKQLAVTGRQLADTEEKLQEQSRSLDGSRLTLATQEIARLRLAMAELDARQADAIVGFVRPREMVAMLKELIGQLPQLKLLKVQSFVARPLPEPAAAGKRPVRPRVYEHAVLMEFEGDYFGALQYFRRLEAMPRRFYWDFAGYQVMSYPVARISVVIHTLSTSDAWLGV